MNIVFPFGLRLLDELRRLFIHSLRAPVRLDRTMHRAGRGVLDFQILSLFGVSVRFFVVGRMLLVVVPSPVLAVAVVACPARGVRGLATLVELLVVPVVFGATLLMICVLLRLVPTRKSLLSPGKSKKVVSSPLSCTVLFVQCICPTKQPGPWQ